MLHTTGPTIEAGIQAVVLAPMEGVTDAPMRAFLSEQGGLSFCVAEFVRVSHSVPRPRVFLDRVPELACGGCTPTGAPVQVQLLGGDPERLAQAAAHAVEAGARAVDLNFGCPVPTVNRHDGGATLLKHPARIRSIVAAVRAALPPDVPVSAKLRLGWDDPAAIHDNAARAAEGGAAWITIHGRTRAQGYRPPAYWKPIGEIRRRLGIPVVANGDISSIEALRRCQDETGCQHFMLGRGSLAAPGLAREAAHELRTPGATRPTAFNRSPGQWLPLVQRFVEIAAAMGMSPEYAVNRIKQWLRLANHDGRMGWFDALKSLRSLSELLNGLDDAAHHRGAVLLESGATRSSVG